MNKKPKNNFDLLTSIVIGLLIFGLIWNWQGGNILIKAATSKTSTSEVGMEKGEQGKIELCIDENNNYTIKNFDNDEIIGFGIIGDTYWQKANELLNNKLNNTTDRFLQQGAIFIPCIMIVVYLAEITGLVYIGVTLIDSLDQYGPGGPPPEERMRILIAKSIDMCEKIAIDIDPASAEKFESQYNIPFTTFDITDLPGMSREEAAKISVQIFDIGTEAPTEEMIRHFLQGLLKNCRLIYIQLINGEGDYRQFLEDILAFYPRFFEDNDFPTSGYIYRLDLAEARDLLIEEIMEVEKQLLDEKFMENSTNEEYLKLEFYKEELGYELELYNTRIGDHLDFITGKYVENVTEIGDPSQEERISSHVYQQDMKGEWVLEAGTEQVDHYLRTYPKWANDCVDPLLDPKTDCLDPFIAK